MSQKYGLKDKKGGVKNNNGMKKIVSIKTHEWSRIVQ